MLSTSVERGSHGIGHKVKVCYYCLQKKDDVDADGLCSECRRIIEE